MGCFGFLSKYIPCLRGKAETVQIFQLSPKLRPRLTEAEILQQLRDDGIVPKARPGGVAFHVGQDRLYFPAPPRRLSRLPTPRHYTSEERHLMADLIRYDKLVDQVQKKALDRDTKIYLARKKRTSKLNFKKMLLENKLKEREERMKKLEEERETKKKEKEERKREKREKKLKRCKE